MAAIFKRELKAYFSSPIAYAVIALFVLMTGIFFLLVNLINLNADFTLTISSVGFLLLFVAPILTMRTIAEDRKNGTEVLLVTSPASISNIVIGKFLAAFCVFLVMVVITLIYPIILSFFGNPPIPQLIGSYIGFILLGAACIAFGVLASALTENQIVAATISFLGLLVMWFADSIGFYAGGIGSKILSGISIISRYAEFSRGILNLSPVIYYLSITCVFIFITIQVIERRRWSQG